MTPDFRLERRLHGTDRGDLWLGRRGSASQCLVRLLDNRFADASFRASLATLAHNLTTRRPARVLQIVDHNWLENGEHYYIQYDVDLPLRALDEHFMKQHWLERLRFVKDILDIGQEQWRVQVAPPIGFHGGRVVACRLADRWLAHLAPCPPPPMHSPYDFIHANPTVLAAIAPEQLRHVPGTGVAEDVYAAAVLVLQALGKPVASASTPEALLETQARSMLITTGMADTQLEPAIRRIRPFADCLAALEGVLNRCVAFDASARPTDTELLRSACAKLLDIAHPCDIALDLDDGGHTVDALQLLNWASSCLPDDPMVFRMAAELCRRLELPGEELVHLERLLKVERDQEAAHRRMELRYDAYIARASSVRAGRDPEGDWLLAELQRFLRASEFRLASNLGLEDDERRVAKEDRLRSVLIRGRRGDLYGRARDLFEMTKLEPKDVASLYLYALSYHDLTNRFGLAPEERQALLNNLEQLVRAALHRIVQLGKAESLDEKEATQWADRFQSLRSSSH